MRNFSALQIISPGPLPQTNDNALQTLLTDFFILLGAAAVLMIIIAGVRYIFARGNAEATAKAKNMIQYSVMGLVIAALAASIVNIVLDKAG
jgi:cytochrome bd-type quinol oxidase subunit 2